MSAPQLKVILRGEEIILKPGGATSAAVEPAYRDAPDAILAGLQEDISQGIPWREAAQQRLGKVNPWLLRIVTDPARILWLKMHPPRPGSWVLDVGSGWGQWAVPAATTGTVVALEPTPARLAAVRAIAQQEGCDERMFFVGAALEAVSFPHQRFDHIYCIGVLEWVPKFHTTLGPLEAQRNFLRQMRGLLADRGECIIGIENRLGLKYLLGARDDHTGLANISVLDAAAAAQRHLAQTGQPLRMFTHAQSEYQALLTEAGFSSIEFFAAFPDYKVPQVIVSIADGAANQHCLNGPFIPEHDGHDGSALVMQDMLASHYHSLAEFGIAGPFAPSFYIRALR